LVSFTDVGFAITVLAVVALVATYVWGYCIRYYEPIKGGVELAYFTILRKLGKKIFDTYTGMFWDVTGVFESDRRAQLNWRARCLELRRKQIAALTNWDGTVKDPRNEWIVKVLREWLVALWQNRKITFGDQMRILVTRDWDRKIDVFLQVGYVKPLTEYAMSDPYGEPEMLWWLPRRITRRLIEGWVQDIPPQESEFFRMVPELAKVRNARWHWLVPKPQEEAGPPVAYPSEQLAYAVATWPAARILQRTEDIMRRHVSAAKEEIRKSAVANYSLAKKEADIKLGLQYWNSEGKLKIEGATETPMTTLAVLLAIATGGAVIGGVSGGTTGAIVGVVFGGAVGLMAATQWQTRRG
jgi:hypothetical protein